MTETVRYTIDIAATTRETLGAWATECKLTQGELIEVLLSFTRDSAEVKAALQAKREAKVATREERRKLMNALRALPPEQLIELNAIAQAQGKAPA